MNNNKSLYNNISSIVQESIDGYLLNHPHLTRLDAFPKIKVILKRPDLISCNCVGLISGGGAGHTPAHEGYIGLNMLTAAVSGEIFASPSTAAILAAIHTIHNQQLNNNKGNSNKNAPGILLIIKNYTGDRLNFGLAAEQAKLRYNINCEMVIVGDDCTMNRNKGITGRRGIAGTVLVHKIAGAAASEGLSLQEVATIADNTAKSIVSMGIATSTCNIPGSNTENKDRINNDEYELGLGIHGEAGLEKLKFDTANNIVKKLLSVMLSKDKDRDYFWNECNSAANGNHENNNTHIKVVLLVNNLGSTTPAELSLIAKTTMEQLKTDYSIEVVRLFAGTYMSALDMRGFSLSLMRLPNDQNKLNQQLKWLDLDTDASGWKSKGILSTNKPIAIEMKTDSTVNTTTTNDSTKSRAVLKSVAEALISSESKLNELDKLTGDGDCGSTFKGACQQILNEIDTIDYNSLGKLFESLTKYAELAGGTSGAIYQILFTSIAHNLQQQQANDSVKPIAQLANALEAGISAVSKYGGARAGDRTLLDALIPAVQSFKSHDTVESAIKFASEAARVGADSTKSMQARAGRSNYVAASHQLNVVDPGAEAQSIIWSTISKQLA